MTGFAFGQLSGGATPSATPIAGNAISGGAILSIFGALNSAIGAFYDIRALKSQESNLRHQQNISQINARGAEFAAQGIQEAGQREIGRQTMQAGAQKASRRASQGGRGIVLGTGSAAEVDASGDIIAEIDRFSIEGNIARATAAARSQRVNFENQGLLAGASAGNVRASRRSINPYTGVATSLLSSAGTLSREWGYAQRRR